MLQGVVDAHPVAERSVRFEHLAERLADGNAAVALLANTVATGAALVFLIIALAPISGAHLNPAVSFVAFLDGRLSIKETISYIVFQIAGGALGTCAANIMFQLPAIYVSAKERSGGAQLLAELVATFGLIATVIALTRRPNPLHVIAAAVACYIVAAYWFTSSTSFANPAVTIARTLSDTFAGIRPQDAPGFIAAQFVGASAAFVLFRWLFTEENL